MLATLEQAQLGVSIQTEKQRKLLLGQFFTPDNVARFMAGLFMPASGGECHLLDPGAGIGSLAGAFLGRCRQGDLCFDSLHITACELDRSLHHELRRTLSGGEIHGGDFIEWAVNSQQFNQAGKFTHALLNPPYQKIRSDSLHRALLRQVGIETVNLYSAFVALTLLMMVQGGQVVALIPRSFCNGPYYRPFRELLLKQAAIRHIHLFGSRSKTFKSDGVLQENVIVVLERGSVQGDVTITHSTDGRFADMVTHRHPFSQIVRTDDSEYFIHVPTSSANNEEDMPPALRHSLDEVAIQVSTGPVVDFRLKEYLRDAPEVGTVPLLYPTHFTGEQIVWPKLSKKPNAIQCNVATEKWLYPSGFYCVVRRFSSKEEARRIVASVVYPEAFGGAEKLGFENHLNVFHEGKQGLPKALAYGLAVYLNTTWVDESFRRSSGHTQVNATDLRVMKYPSRQALMALGEWAICSGALTQGVIDEQVAELGEL